MMTFPVLPGPVGLVWICAAFAPFTVCVMYVIRMVRVMEEHFGSCTMFGECEAVCPKEISIDFIALMNRDYAKAQLAQRRLVGQRFP